MSSRAVEAMLDELSPIARRELARALQLELTVEHARVRASDQRAYHATTRPYARAEVVACVRRCALELACRPSSTTYARWSTTKRRLARERGIVVRIASFRAIYRHFPGSRRQRWQRVVAACALTDEQLADAFVRRMRLEHVELTPADELDDQALEQLQTAGVSEASIELLESGRGGDLPLGQAVLAARAWGCSLAYLAGDSRERGRPPAQHIRFDPFVYQERRKQLRLPVNQVRKAVGLSVHDARRLALGTLDPTLRVAIELETMLGPGILARMPRRSVSGAS